MIKNRNIVGSGIFILMVVGVLSISITLNSCSNKSVLSKTLEGWWTIDQNQISFKGEDLTHCILGNSIFFESNNKCKFPTTRSHCSEIAAAFNENGTWEIVKGDRMPYTVKIVSNNALFAGMHEVRFERDSSQKLLKMIISSSNLTLRCSKGLFDYDANKELIDELLGN